MLKKIIAAIQEWNKLRLKGLAKGITIDPPYKFLHRKAWNPPPGDVGTSPRFRPAEFLIAFQCHSEVK